MGQLFQDCFMNLKFLAVKQLLVERKDLILSLQNEPSPRHQISVRLKPSYVTRLSAMPNIPRLRSPECRMSRTGLGAKLLTSSIEVGIQAGKYRIG